MNYKNPLSNAISSIDREYTAFIKNGSVNGRYKQESRADKYKNYELPKSINNLPPIANFLFGLGRAIFAVCLLYLTAVFYLMPAYFLIYWWVYLSFPPLLIPLLLLIIPAILFVLCFIDTHEKITNDPKILTEALKIERENEPVKARYILTALVSSNEPLGIRDLVGLVRRDVFSGGDKYYYDECLLKTHIEKLLQWLECDGKVTGSFKNGVYKWSIK